MRKQNKYKITPVTLQIMMTDREVVLLEELGTKLSITKSAIIAECGKRIVERWHSEQTAENQAA